MKIDFEHITVFTDLEQKIPSVANERKEIANVIYTQGQGLECHALALKIWNGNADTEYSDDEVKLIMRFVEHFFAPCFIDAMRHITQKTEE